jgi:hypothetical protein
MSSSSSIVEEQKQDFQKVKELRHAAKWSSNIEEKKNAIRELASTFGERAIPVLNEIKGVTVYEEIKQACAEAIKTIREEITGQQKQPEQRGEEEKGKSLGLEKEPRGDQDREKPPSTTAKTEAGTRTERTAAGKKAKD